MAQIIPIKDLKDTAALSARVNASEEPIFVTKNGYGDMVIMSMKVYESLAGTKKEGNRQKSPSESGFSGAFI